MTLGYLQKSIIQLGREKGKVTSYDVQKLYPNKEIRIVMNKLIALGYFKPAKDKITFIEWEFDGGKK